MVVSGRIGIAAEPAAHPLFHSATFLLLQWIGKFRPSKVPLPLGDLDSSQFSGFAQLANWLNTQTRTNRRTYSPPYVRHVQQQVTSVMNAVRPNTSVCIGGIVASLQHIRPTQRYRATPQIRALSIQSLKLPVCGLLWKNRDGRPQQFVVWFWTTYFRKYQ